MTFGRPAAISDDYVRLELPIPYETVLEMNAPAKIRNYRSVLFFKATMFSLSNSI